MIWTSTWLLSLAIIKEKVVTVTTEENAFICFAGYLGLVSFIITIVAASIPTITFAVYVGNFSWVRVLKTLYVSGAPRVFIFIKAQKRADGSGNIFIKYIWTNAPTSIQKQTRIFIVVNNGEKIICNETPLNRYWNS